MKECRRCHTTKPSADFGKDKRYRDGLASWCRDCFRENNRKWFKANRDRHNARVSGWREANPDAARKIALEYHRRNAEARGRKAASWAKANSDKRAASTARRKAAKLRATPGWADLEAIAAIYAEAKRIQRETGVRMHVDHIIPLQHPLICGLHCEQNLRIIPGAENESKRNKWEGAA